MKSYRAHLLNTGVSFILSLVSSLPILAIPEIALDEIRLRGGYSGPQRPNYTRIEDELRRAQSRRTRSDPNAASQTSATTSNVNLTRQRFYHRRRSFGFIGRPESHSQAHIEREG